MNKEKEQPLHLERSIWSLEPLQAESLGALWKGDVLPDKAKGLVFDICYEYSPNKMNITEENTRTDNRYGRQRSMSRVPNSQNLRNVPVFIQIFQNTLQRTMLADEFKGSLCPNTCKNKHAA